MKISNQQYSQILDYISGELDEQSRADVEIWINLSDENKRTYYKILKKSLYSRWSLKIGTIDQDVELKKFERRITAKTRFLSYAAVAASIIIVISISVLSLWNTSIFKQEQIFAKTTVVEPGERGAELILSTGEIINISATKSQIKERDGSVIQVDSVYGVGYQSISTNTTEQIYNTLKIARGREFNLILSDGTRVWLNAESELKYPVQFIGDKRQVFLKGEAYFDVTPNKEKAFVVKSYDQQVKVYGTEFCVNAYNQNEIKTVLVEGSIGVKANSKGIEAKLKPGELGLAYRNTGQMNVKKVNVRPYIAWKDGDFVFENELLENIMMRLERWYNVKVFFMNEECKTYRFTADIERYSEVKDLLFFMETTSNAKFEIKNNAILVKVK